MQFIPCSEHRGSLEARVSIRTINHSPLNLRMTPVWDARVNSETGRNLLNLRDATEHARRRRPWVRAFTPASVKEYEPILTRRILQLADCLQKASVDGVVYLNEWISYFTFDFMGDLAFGGGFEIMREGDTNGYWRLLNDAVK